MPKETKHIIIARKGKSNPQFNYIEEEKKNEDSKNKRKTRSVYTGQSQIFCRSLGQNNMYLMNEKSL